MEKENNDLRQIADYYDAGAEVGRLRRGIGVIEWERSREIISRYLPKDTITIYDIGGGIGEYSRWLAGLGHEVHLFDLSSASVAYAQDLQKTESSPRLASIEQADGRTINRPSESADIVLLMGPLYHLPDREERLAALKEAFRLLKPGGILLAASISRFSSTLWGLSVYGQKNEVLEEASFRSMIGRELAEGQHIRPEEYPGFIARAFFHLPEEMREEIRNAGFEEPELFAVEGPLWIVPALEDKWNEPDSRKMLLELGSALETQENLLGMSPHLLAAARKGRSA
ncbi:class I SAM-dependent methyltransferase [Paenibacillus sp. HN-1]|uniref:class I SAM-dependent methyltransferase n=1 Tax=Paenibacillus TaxID=44249 RepID=UPI001CA977BA|nr:MULTISPECIES: class I SAM-dependent methyltransferase [Paenibacillus]MBY9080878.1 class I SAM-dependent methyltransferase [Paenibacillus sp. CGMCC 1.18879]MBY9085130.1 class I SAM-dependent methyltransferase [Paenibacillus sinensis]